MAPGEVYTGGIVIACLFCVVFGALQLGGAANHTKAIGEGRVAARLAFSAIDHVPKILVNETNK